MGELLIGTAGILALLAVGAYEKWKRRTAPSRAESREPAPHSWRPVANALARAVSPLSASLEAFRDENHAQAMVAIVYGMNRSLKLRSTGRTEGDVETGHLGFDRQLYVQANPDRVRALLDAPTRDALLDLLRGPLRGGELAVDGGELRAVVPAGGYASLADAVPLIARVARRLATHIDVPSELARSARTDSVSGVRLLCLRTLLREYSSQASIVHPVVRQAAGDPDAEVRLEAAMALGTEGLPVLEALVADASVEDGLSARAAEALGDRMPAHVARATLWQELAASIRRHRLATACACASALGLRGEPQDEDLLLQALPEGRDEALRLSAARALGAIGSVRAVPSLAELSSSDSGALRRAGGEAIAAIQSRLPGATPGQLSLGTADSGHVSLADDVAGRLSDPDRSGR
ncbi:MAG TPA: HEAT repeat domain-containing protein [Vicinamibacteria bacterium]|nr:HEAT repeat domain-containing protein [Vicinamibacteria bacterium]